MKIYVIRYYYNYQNLFSILSFVILDGTFLIWLVYGNIIFYSSKNQCNAYETSQILYNLMLVLLIIGYFQMLIYVVLICFLPCFYFYFVRSQGRQRRPLSDQAIPRVLRTLTRTKFDPEKFTNEENVCSICYIEYNNEDLVTPLSCNPKHYYHTECIERWI